MCSPAWRLRCMCAVGRHLWTRELRQHVLLQLGPTSALLLQAFSRARLRVPSGAHSLRSACTNQRRHPTACGPHWPRLPVRNLLCQAWLGESETERAEDTTILSTMRDLFLQMSKKAGKWRGVPPHANHLLFILRWRLRLVPASFSCS